MKVKRNNLTDQLSNFQEAIDTPTKKESVDIQINYDKIIQRQAQIIQNLYKQCVSLRQKINRMKTQELFASQKKQLPQQNMQKFAQNIQKQILKQIATMLEITKQNQITKPNILHTLKRWKWQRNKRMQPIFIQRIKQVRVPVPIQIQKPVQKIVVQEKIVIQQKIIQKPIFRQKIVEKFISKIQENPLSLIVSNLSKDDSSANNSNNLQNGSGVNNFSQKQKIKSDDNQSINLSTNSNPKCKRQQMKQKLQVFDEFQTTVSNNKNNDNRAGSSCIIIDSDKNKVQKMEYYKPDKSNFQGNSNFSNNFNLRKKPSLGDLKQQQSVFVNKTTYNHSNYRDRQSFGYNNNNIKKSSINNRNNQGKNNMKSPSSYIRNNKNDQWDRYQDNDEQQTRYRKNYETKNYENRHYQTRQFRQNNNDKTYYKNDSVNNKQSRNSQKQKTYYKHSNDRNKDYYSPKPGNYNEDKYYENDRNYYDPNRFLDSSKINPNKNIKRRDKNDYYANRKER